jgi:uncharacterized membrane protein
MCLLVYAFLVLVLLWPGVALAAPPYTLVDLGTQVMLASVTPDGTGVGNIGGQAVLVRRGQAPEVLPLLPNGLGATAYSGIQDATAGVSGVAPIGAAHATLWDKGGVHDLGTLGGPDLESVARAVSKTVVAGYCVDVHDNLLPCRWSRPGGAAQALPTLGGTYGFVAAINQHGILVGQSTTSTNVAHATLWVGTIPVDLTPQATTYSAAYAVNEHTVVVGRLGQHAMRWSAEAGLEDLGLLKGDVFAQLQGINQHGVAVGVSAGGAETEVASKAIRTHDTTLEDLNTLVDLPPGWHLVQAVGISDGGVIGGRAVVDGPVGSEIGHAVLLVPREGR